MFAVLNIRPKSDKVYKRMWEYAFPKKTEILQTAVRNGAPFFTVNVSRIRGEIPWDEISFYAGNCAERMLLPKGVIPPATSRVKAFVPKLLPQRVLFNTACELLSRISKNPIGKTITLIDMNGDLTREVHRLVPFASTVRVVTKKEELYEPFSEKIMEDFGASLLITDNVDSAADSNIIIAPDGLTDEILPSKTCIVFSGREQPSQGYVSVTGRDMNLQPCYRRIVPQGIEPDIFAAALFEKCGVVNLVTLTYTRLHLYGTDTTLCGAAKMLAAIQQGS